MLYAISAIHGFAIAASDGEIGTLSDLLFDDRTWKVRWLIVETGSWLSERKVLVHPSAVREVDLERRRIAVNLTKAQVEGSLAITRDLPVSRQMEHNLYDYYAWDPMWGGVSYFDAGVPPVPIAMSMLDESADDPSLRPGAGSSHDDGDPHLRSIDEITGYDLQAKDGGIGHVENFLFEDLDWSLRYLIVDTKNWCPGKHVLLSPYAVAAIDWSRERIDLHVTRDAVRSGPEWDPVAIIDRAYEADLHRHYGWRGYGW